MRRVLKSEVQIDTFVKPDGLSVCLECWKDWMLSDDRDLSASRMKLQGGTDDADRDRAGYDSDPYSEQRKADFKIGEATGAMIEDLKPAWRWAIYKKCGISTQWKFPQLDYLAVLVQAETALSEKLKKNIATAIHF